MTRGRWGDEGPVLYGEGRRAWRHGTAENSAQVLGCSGAGVLGGWLQGVRGQGLAGVDGPRPTDRRSHALLEAASTSVCQTKHGHSRLDAAGRFTGHPRPHPSDVWRHRRVQKEKPTARLNNANKAALCPPSIAPALPAVVLRSFLLSNRRLTSPLPGSEKNCPRPPSRACSPTHSGKGSANRACLIGVRLPEAFPSEKARPSQLRDVRHSRRCTCSQQFCSLQLCDHSPFFTNFPTQA